MAKDLQGIGLIYRLAGKQPWCGVWPQEPPDLHCVGKGIYPMCFQQGKEKDNHFEICLDLPSKEKMLPESRLLVGYHSVAFIEE